MNFPAGHIVSKGSLPNSTQSLFNDLISKSFNGYIVQSVKGDLIEEGIIFFREGAPVACLVECLGVLKTFKGDEAFSFFLNQTVGHGFFQVVELTRSQVDLVTAFDEKLLFVSKINLKDLPKLIPSTFRVNFRLEKENNSILDAYGLGGLK